MKEQTDYVALTKWRLRNSLKGQAMMCKDQNSMMATQEEKMEEMKVIEQFLRYVEDYEANQRMIAEYKDMQARLIDDGR